jgi:transketolase
MGKNATRLVPCVNTIRTLPMDAVQAANSDNPGTSMALGPVGMRSFGASEPLKQLIQKFGFTIENVVDAACEQVREAHRRADQ